MMAKYHTYDMHELGFNFLYPLLHAAHQNLIIRISPSTQK